MSLFDLLQAGMGRPDPRMQIAAALGRAPGQAGGSPGPVPLAPGGPVGPGGGSPAPPAGGPPVGAPGPGAPPQQQQQQQLPQAYQSPPDLLQMYSALSQRDRSEDQFNRGLALMAASAYPGRRPDLIMNSVPQAEDPGQTFRALAGIQQMNYLQTQQQAFMQAVPELAQKYNIPANEIMAIGPEGMRQIVLNEAGVGGGQAWMAQQRAERTLTAQGKPIPWTPGDPTSYMAYTQAQTAQQVTEAKSKETDASEAKNDFAKNDADYNNLERLVDWLNAHPDATTKAIKSLGPTTGVGGAIRQWLPDAGGVGLDSETATAASYLDQMQKVLYSEGWKGRSRVTQQEAFRLQGQWTQFANPALPAGEIPGQLDTLSKQIRETHGNAFGAAGQATPGKYWGVMNPIYKKGGDRFAGATQADDGGDTPAPSGGGGGGGADFSKMSAADADAAYEKLPHGATFVDTDGKAKRKP